MYARKEIARLLKESGAVLRRGKHSVWHLPNGRNFVESVSPSDHRAPHTSLALLRRLLGAHDPERGSPGEPPERKPKLRSQTSASTRRRPEEINLLKLSGIIKAPLKERVSALLEEVRSNRRPSKS